MARPIVFPNIMRALPPVRIQPPQNNSGTLALLSGLGAVTEVANNWRQKQQLVDQAKKTADLLEREGLTQEANLYRGAADNFSVNFFATPQENQKFNQSLLKDTLGILEAKQNRDLRELQIKSMAEQRAALLQDRVIDNRRADERLGFEREKAGLDRADRADRAKTATIQRQEGILNSQLGQNQRSQQELIKARRDGAISQDEFAKQMGPLKDQENSLSSAMEQFQRSVLGEGASGIPSISRSLGRIPEIKSEVEESEEWNAAASQFAEAEGAKYPGLRLLKFRGKDIQNPHFRGSSTTTTGTDREGNPYSSTSTTTPLAPSPSRGMIPGPRDPLLLE